jgi:branched-chain amino acid aminotransferase
VVERNEPLRAAIGDWWVGQRISRGVDAVGDEGWDHTGAQVIVDCTPLPLRARARLFRDGIDVIIPSIRRVPPSMQSPRAKTHNYLNLILADKEVKARHPEAWSVLLDSRQPRRGTGSNIFVVCDGRLHPREPTCCRREPQMMDLAADYAVRARHRPLRRGTAAGSPHLTSPASARFVCQQLQSVRARPGRSPPDHPGLRPGRTDFVAQYPQHLANPVTAAARGGHHAQARLRRGRTRRIDPAPRLARTARRWAPPRKTRAVCDRI